MDQWIGKEWWVFRASGAVLEEPHLRWAGPFESKQKADEWISKQRNWQKGLRAGKMAVVWEE